MQIATFNNPFPQANMKQLAKHKDKSTILHAYNQRSISQLGVAA